MPLSLTNRTIGALLWVGGGRAAQAVLRLLALVVLARLLSPGDFGVVSAAMIVIGLSLIFSHLGLGPAIVQRPEIEARHLDTAFVASVTLGLALGGVIWWFAPAAARFFSQVDRFEPVLRALAWLFPLGGLSVVAESQLQRELRFRFLAGTEIASFAVGYGVVGVPLAASGFGVWALVAAQLTQTALHTTILLFARPPRLHFTPDRRAFAELMYFGTGFTAAKIANYIALQGDNVVVGRWLGAGALGLYGRAYELMAAPVQLLGEALDRVLFPAMARIQSDRERLASGFRRGVALIALVMLPTSGVLFVLAPELIDVVLGAQWTGVVVPFQILALGMFLRTSYRISDALVRATGAVYRRAWRQAVYATLVLGGAWFGRHWGIEGVACGVLAALLVNFYLMAQLSLRLLGLTWRGFWKLHRPAAVVALVVGSAAAGLAALLRHAHAAPALLLVTTLGGTVIVALLAVWVRPQVFLGPDGRWFVGALWTYARAFSGGASPQALDERSLERPRA